MEVGSSVGSGGRTSSARLGGGHARICFCGFPLTRNASWDPARLGTLGDSSPLWASVHSPVN